MGSDFLVIDIQYQHGPRDESGSIPGATDDAILAIVLDRYEGFQAGKYACPENDEVIHHIKAAAAAMRARANKRAARGVLGKNQK
jgi:hypothetical protein